MCLRHPCPNLCQLVGNVDEGGPPFRVKQQAVVYNLAEVFVDLRWGAQLVFEVANHGYDLGRRAPVKGDLTSKHFPENHTEAIDVGCGGSGVWVGSDEFRRSPLEFVCDGRGYFLGLIGEGIVLN